MDIRPTARDADGRNCIYHSYPCYTCVDCKSTHKVCFASAVMTCKCSEKPQQWANRSLRPVGMDDYQWDRNGGQPEALRRLRQLDEKYGLNRKEVEGCSTS